jgi:uncharacterized membrane protein SpoIIM required for sporulation
MMTPLRFESLYENEWVELEGMLDRLRGRRTPAAQDAAEVSGARLAALYRRACEQLALARARAYPAYLTDRLERVTADAHQLVYQQRELGFARARELVTTGFPRSVRHHRFYVAAACAAFLLPTVIVGLLVHHRPELILSVVRAETVASFEQMYSPAAESIGRARDASTDWVMFGYYIRNNVGVAFQCFAAGLFAGLGSLFFLAYNGIFSGALAGYLASRGLSPTFFSFIVTHSAFELTAIVLSGAAGLRIGHALLAPGRCSRLHALVQASRESVILLYGATGLLLIAAGIEAFWSSASWISHSTKYAVAAVCWLTVFAYFIGQGRRAA